MNSIAEGNANLKHLSGPSAFDPMDCLGEHIVSNQGNQPIKTMVERALGDNQYSVRLGEEDSLCS